MPKAFISYSWDDASHKTWVREFATRLRNDGIETILDQWHSAPGEQLPAFMEQAVRDNDFVLIVCTPKYRAKFDNRTAGVGYEGDIIQGEVFVKNNHRKFIPILRRGTWEEVAPSALLGSYYVDLRQGSDDTSNYQDLVQTLQGLRPKPPDLGTATSNPTLARTLVKPLTWTMVLDGSYDESVKGRVEVVVKHLQQLLGDSSLTIQKIQQGSIIVRFKGSEAGFNLMKALFDSGKVTQLDGFKLLQVSMADEFALANMTSRELIAEASRGVREAWLEFQRRWNPTIVRVVTSSAMRSGDSPATWLTFLVQEVYLKLAADGFKMLQDPSCQTEFAFSLLLDDAVANIVDNRLKLLDGKDRTVYVISDLGLKARGVIKSVDDFDKSILSKVVDRIIEASDSLEERHVLRLHFWKGLSAEAIADDPMIKLPTRSVETMIWRARKAVWRELKETGVTNLSEPALNKILRGVRPPRS